MLARLTPSNLFAARGHIAYDLMPYSFVFESCSSSAEFYRTTDDWIGHMKESHGRTMWICETCPTNPPTFDVPVFDAISDWRDHMLSQHETKFSLPKETMALKLSERRILGKVRCPLCPRSFESRSLEEDDHIAEHMHSLALRAIPWEGNPEAIHSDDRILPDGPLVKREAEPSSGQVSTESSSTKHSSSSDRMDLDEPSLPYGEHIPDANLKKEHVWMKNFGLWKDDRLQAPGNGTPPPLSVLEAPDQLTCVSGPMSAWTRLRPSMSGDGALLSAQNFVRFQSFILPLCGGEDSCVELDTNINFQAIIVIWDSAIRGPAGHRSWTLSCPSSHQS